MSDQPTIDVEFSPTLGALCAALVEFQRTVPVIPKSSKANAGGSYSYTYAELPDVLAVTREPLAVQGLAVSQPLGTSAVVTLLMHTSGEWIKSRCDLTSFKTAQEMGSAITYVRRYAVQSILNIAPDEDDDGTAASGGSSTKAKPASAPQAPASAPSGPTALALESQVKKLFQIAEKRDVAEAVLVLICAERHLGIAHPRELTKPQCSAFIEWLGKATDDDLDAAVAKVQAAEATG